MNGITVPMAIMDFIPVVMFFVAAVILQRDLYNKLVKGAFALLAAGSIMVFLGGFYKASWKVLYALNICNFEALDIAMFPLQAPGFLLVFLGLTALKKKDFGSPTALAVAPVLYKSNLIFIIMQVISFGGIQYCMARIALFMKKRFAAVLFVLSFIFILGMGYLGAKFDDSSSMHWLAQGTNILSQGCFMWGTLILHKAGLQDMKAKDEDNP